MLFLRRLYFLTCEPTNIILAFIYCFLLEQNVVLSQLKQLLKEKEDLHSIKTLAHAI